MHAGVRSFPDAPPAQRNDDDQGPDHGDALSTLATAVAQRHQFSAVGFSQRVAEKRSAHPRRGFLSCRMREPAEGSDPRIVTQLCVCGEVLAVVSERSAVVGPRQQSLSVMSLQHPEVSMIVWPKRNSVDGRLIAKVSALPDALCEERSRRFLTDRKVPEAAILRSIHLNIGYTTGAAIDGCDVFLVRYAPAEGAGGSEGPECARHRFVAVSTSTLFYSRPDATARNGVTHRAQMSTQWLTGVGAPRLQWGVIAAGYCNAMRTHELQVWKRGAHGADVLAKKQITVVCSQQNDTLLEVSSDRLQHVVVFVERFQGELIAQGQRQLRITSIDFGTVDTTSRLHTCVFTIDAQVQFCGASVCGGDVAMALRNTASGHASVRVMSMEDPTTVRIINEIDMTSQIPRCVCIHGGMIVISSLLDDFEFVSMCHTRSKDTVTLSKHKTCSSSPVPPLLDVDTFYVAHTVITGGTVRTDHEIRVHPHPMVPAISISKPTFSSAPLSAPSSTRSPLEPIHACDHSPQPRRAMKRVKT